MATDAHTRATPMRAPSFPQLVPLEDAKIALSNIGGTLSLLVAHLEEHVDKLGTGPVYATYHCLYSIEAAGRQLEAFNGDLLAFRNAQEGR